MSRREWSLLVADMQDAIEKIGVYTDAMTFADFQADSRTVDAVVHNLLVIGEAARCLPDVCQMRSRDSIQRSIGSRSTAYAIGSPMSISVSVSR